MHSANQVIKGKHALAAILKHVIWHKQTVFEMY